MPRKTKKKEIVVEEKLDAKEAETAVVSYRGKQRIYSREMHGDNFVELAKSFQSKFGGELLLV